ncbi:MAG: flagellar export chaperone FliS [Clostridiales bacterium 38-18]|nr:MAG: flagellar export chaperone FliS [Clostridiales bacterium 38-18]
MDQYLESKIIAAKPEELTYMLYEGMVKFIKKALLFLESGNHEQVNYNTQRAQAIVDELRSTLNMDVPLSVSLDTLYEYLNYKLLLANVDKSESHFNEALEIAENFKDTWKEAFNIK